MLNAFECLPHRLLITLYRHRIFLLWTANFIAGLFALGHVLDPQPLSYALTDLLVNSQGGPVRRALSGNTALSLSDWTKTAPALWAWAIGFTGATALTGAVIRLYRHLPEDTGLALLVLSPYGILFYAYDPEATFRKEIFAMLALALTLNAALPKTGRRMATAMLAAAALVFAFALGLSETNLFLWPAFALALKSVVLYHPGLKWPAATAALTVLAFGVVMAVQGFLAPAVDISTACLAARVEPCSGAFYFLQQDLQQLIGFALGHDLMDIPISLVVLMLGLLPVVFARGNILPGLSPARTALVLVLAVLPLFLVGYDWGRWVVMATLSLNLLLTTAVAQGRVTFSSRLPAVLVVLYLLLAMDHATMRLLPNALFLLVISLPLMLWDRFRQDMA